MSFTFKIHKNRMKNTWKQDETKMKYALLLNENRNVKKNDK